MNNKTERMIVERIAQLVDYFDRDARIKVKLRMGKRELEGLKHLGYDSCPSEELVRNGTELEWKRYIDTINENHRGFRTGDHFMGIPIVKVDEESCLEVI